MDCDIAVVGGGLSGLTSALFAARSGRATVAFTGGGLGGQLLNIGRIEDYPGFPEGVAGFELCPGVEEQAVAAGASFRDEAVEALERRNGSWLLSAGDEQLEAGAVIVATGRRFKRLGVDGEQQLAGKGVSTCATCDGPLMRGKTVAVIGGGDSALQEALELADHVERVIVVHRGDELDGQEAYRARVLEHASIEVRYATVVERILGDERVEGIAVRDPDGGGETGELELGAVFVYVGLEPEAEIAGDLLALGDDGGVPTDAAMRTELEGLFAAGSVRSLAEVQAAAAAGEGAIAARAADRYLRDRDWR
jgi:thioredoxin reductase (NADPH)